MESKLGEPGVSRRGRGLCGPYENVDVETWSKPETDLEDNEFLDSWDMKVEV